MMAAVKGKNTKPELIVRSTLHRAGFRYSLHKKDLPGRPDLALTKYKVAVFVHGCFWHGHDCPRGKRPSSNTAFWNEKLSKNVERDRRNYASLKQAGWHVVTVWECRIENDLQKLLGLLRKRRDGVGGQSTANEFVR